MRGKVKNKEVDQLMYRDVCVCVCVCVEQQCHMAVNYQQHSTQTVVCIVKHPVTSLN